MEFSQDDALEAYFAFEERMRTTKWPRAYLKLEGEYSVSRYELQAAAEAEMAKLTTIVAAGLHQGSDNATHLPADFPSEVRRWLQTYIQPDAWKRYLAARRQRNAKQRRRESPNAEGIASLPLTWTSISTLGSLAKQAGVNKRQLVHQLTRYLSVTPSGQKAFTDFVSWHSSSRG